MNTPESTPRGQSWASPIFRAFLRFYPPPFQSEFGPDMVETFSCRFADVGKGLARRSLFLLRECIGVGLGGVRLRVGGFLMKFRSPSEARESRGFHEPSFSRRSRDFFPELGQDLRQALRSLGRRPGATASGVAALGMGIGLTTLMFCVIYGAGFRPLPVPGGKRIVHIEQDNPGREEVGLKVRPHTLADWQDQQSSFEALGGFYTASVNLSGGDRPERYFGGFVTTNAFEILRVQPVIGRAFMTEDGRLGTSPVVIISHAIWQTRFGGEADVVGSQIRVNGQISTIVGVMPQDFGFPYWQDVWVPIKLDLSTMARNEGPGLDVFGRLRDGVTLEQSMAEFEGMNARLGQAYPETDGGMQAVIEPYTLSYLGPEAGGGFLVMFLTVFGVLLIACFNVANLLLAVAVTSIRDLAIRVAVGAGRRRVMIKVLQEALVMAAFGAVLGTFLALGGVHFINRYLIATATFPPPFWMVFQVDAPILLFVVGITGICALASGILPALKASRTDVSSLLQENSRGGTSMRMGLLSRLMVTAEITVSAALLVVSGHLAMDVVRISDADYGYPVDDVLTARFGLFQELVPTQDARLSIFDQLQSRLEERPGVVSVALASTLPGEETGRSRFSVMGRSYGEEESLPRARTVRVSPGFFSALDVSLVGGREFTHEDDLEGEPVAIVNESFVQRFLAESEPLGTQVRFGGEDDGLPWMTVVGVVPDMNMDGGLEPAGNPEGIYRPIAQGNATFLSVAVRTQGDPLAFAPVLRDEVAGLQRDTPIFYVKTLRDAINNNLLNFILIGGLFWAFALAAFLMAAIGLYSVTAFLASQRTRELGLRVALGAGTGGILRLVLRKGVFQIILGLALGVAIAALGRVAVDGGSVWAPPWDGTIVLVVSSLLGGTGLAAVLTPALRATRVDPVEALREE